jgi:hypothetical protein
VDDAASLYINTDFYRAFHRGRYQPRNQFVRVF